jgi:integrase
LFDMVEDHYAVAGFRSAAQLRSRLKHLRPFFGRTEARHVSRADLLAYSRRRKEEGARAATINRELEVVGRAFRMGRQAGQTENPLTIEKLREAPPRQGFFDAGEVAALLARLPDYLRAPVEFAWLTGWRRGEVFGLEWRQVDFGAGEIRLGTSKTDRPRVFPITPRIGELLESVKPEDGTIRALVFTRYGRPVADFRKAWATACAAIGKPGTLFHDLRRSAARRMEADGVPRSVIMALMGHSTEAMFHRYRIVSQADLRTVSNLLANRR